MNSLIETARQQHEEIDRYEQALAAIFLQPDRSHKHRLEKEHRASDVLDRIVARKESLKEHYADPSGSRAKEVSALAAPPPPADDLDEFYARLIDIKEFHRKNPAVDARAVEAEVRALVEGPEPDEDEEMVVDPISSLFSGEEGLGRFLDVYIYHGQYINIKGVSRVSYLSYLDLLAKGTPDSSIGKKEKGSQQYLEYITALHSYLISFLKRTKPLIDVTDQEKAAETEFETLWSEDKLEGWERESESAVDGAANGEKKEGEGIWCPACQKMYSKQTVYDAHLKSKKHEKAAARLQATPGAAGSLSTSAAPSATDFAELRHLKLKPAALLTHQTSLLLKSPLIAPLILDTRSNVERRAALTARERELELEEPAVEMALPPTDAEGGGIEEEDEDGEGKIYNPLKLPMGWDGKPIPYWLYKLHGLGVEYRCEICSDYAYMGRKNFERHFQESRHAFGMRALGLPNTKHFHEITKIEDALALAERLKQDSKQDARAVEAMEEVEDAEGNVMDRRTFEDLKRQGLLS